MRIYRTKRAEQLAERLQALEVDPDHEMRSRSVSVGESPPAGGYAIACF
ncbi:hypothetical protein GS682_05440 [Nostoc sp. B(2019)]|nr:hypothetical protein [Nostoc sp. B(2019)]